MSLLDNLNEWFAVQKVKWFGVENTEAVKILANATTIEEIDDLYNSFPEETKNDLSTIAQYEHRRAQLVDPPAHGIFDGIAQSLFDGFQDLSEDMESALSDFMAGSLKGEPSTLSSAFDSAMDPLITGILDLLDPSGDKISKDLFNEVSGAMKPLLKLGLTFTVSSVLAELIHPTKELGFGQVSHFLYDTVGFKALTEAYIAPIRLNLIELPTKYQINAITQPWKPRMGDAVDWFGRGHIGDEGFKELMKFNGMESEWFDPYKRYAAKATSYFMLNAIASAGLYDEEKFKFWLSDAGYGAFKIDQSKLTEYEIDYGLEAPEESQIDFLLRSYRSMSAKAEWSEIKSLGARAFEQGMITEDEYREYLRPVVVNEEVINLRVQMSKLKMAEESKALSRSILEKLYRTNRLTEVEFRERLEQMNYGPEAIDDLVYLVELKKQEDPQELTRAQIEGMFRRGNMNEDEFRARLINFNYTSRDIDLLVLDNKSRMKSTTQEAG